VVAVGALSTDTILLTLGATGLASSDPDLVRAAYLAVDLLVTAVLVPLALAALAIGVLLGLGTRWGLARHWWVLAKLALTIVGASAAAVLLRPSLDQAATTALALPLAQLPTAGIGQLAVRVMLAPTVGVLLLTRRWCLRSPSPGVKPDSAAAEQPEMIKQAIGIAT
jgi:hypothetical protein